MKGFNPKHVGLTGLLLVIILGVTIWVMQKDQGVEIVKQPRNEIEAAIVTGEDVNVTLVAKEPDIINPMTLCVGRHGEIYVSESFTYRYGLKGSPSQDTLTLNPIKRIELDSAGRLSKVTVVAQGFANPVMGLDIYRNKLYATCLNELFSMDIGPDGGLSNKQVLVRDSANPWNPFGMYRVAVGPDARLWLAMADHPDSKPVTLTGSDGTQLRLRGQSGGFVRCNLDGSDLQLVVQGFRAPFAFDFDPWGHLWAVSNGESSPNIYVDVIPGMDYGYHSRNVSYGWLAGKTFLAPPVTEMGSGANTVALHYYSSLFPANNYWGSILIANWGSHGAYPTNRTIKQFIPQTSPVPDSIHSIASHFTPAADTFVTSTDSMFRPVGMAYAPDGGLYVADWHGRDDESDSTGRIFKLTHIGRTPRSTQYNPEEISKMDIKQLCNLLGNANKFNRLDARERLVNAGAEAIPSLQRLAEKGNAFQAAQSIWTLTQMQDSGAAKAMTAGLRHKDARVRALAVRQRGQAAGEPIGGRFADGADSINNQVRRKVFFDASDLAALTSSMLSDPDPEVRLEAALSQRSEDDIRKGLLTALDIASTKRLHYQIGFELGRYGDSSSIMSLYDTAQPAKYQVALIAAQTALNEKTALSDLVKDWDFSKYEDMGKDLVAQIEAGKKNQGQPAEQLIALNWLEEHPRVPNASLTAFLQDCLNDSIEYIVKGTALQVVRQKLLQSDEIRKTVHRIMQSPDPKFPFLPLEAIYTVGSFSDPGNVEDWKIKINDTTETVVAATLRALRERVRGPAFIDGIWQDALKAAQRYPDLSEDFRSAFKKAGLDDSGLRKLPLPAARPSNKDDLSKKVLSGRGSSQRGKWTFTAHCSTCHATRVDDAIFRLGPNLTNIGSATQPAYLIESVLEPNKVLKTGYQLETIETTDGKVFSGQVETRDEALVIRNSGVNLVTLPLEQIKKRTTSHISPMPEGLYLDMTVKELTDLIAYLKSLKESN